MQNDLSLVYMHIFPLVLFVLHYIVVTFKTMNQTPTTTAYSWRVAVYSGVFFKYFFLKKDLWQQFAHSMNTECETKGEKTKTIIERFFLTCTSIYFQFDDRFLHCSAMHLQNWRMYCISFVFFTLKPKSNVFFSASFLLSL